MVESLGLMWEEERGRCGGADPPPPPPDPPRTPKPLCRAVDHIRSQFQVCSRFVDVSDAVLSSSGANIVWWSRTAELQVHQMLITRCRYQPATKAHIYQPSDIQEMSRVAMCVSAATGHS